MHLFIQQIEKVFRKNLHSKSWFVVKKKKNKKGLGIQTERIVSLRSIFLMSNVRLSLIRFLSLTREGILILKKGLRKLLTVLLIRLLRRWCFHRICSLHWMASRKNKIYWLICRGFQHILKKKLKTKTGNKRDIRFLSDHILLRWRLQRKQITDREISKHFQGRHHPEDGIRWPNCLCKVRLTSQNRTYQIEKSMAWQGLWNVFPPWNMYAMILIEKQYDCFCVDREQRFALINIENENRIQLKSPHFV